MANVKQHAEAVRELALKLKFGQSAELLKNRLSESGESAIGFMCDDIAEALAPLLEKTRNFRSRRLAKDAHELDAELTRWESK